MKNYLALIRLPHHIKNLLIFLPLVFSGQLLNTKNLVDSLIAFVAFSLVASIVYIVNDIKDIDNDKNHPVKCKRPLPSGKISVKRAITIGIGCGILALALNTLISSSNFFTMFYLLLYLGLNLLYSFYLKNISFIDITILVSGYYIRLLYGSEVIDVSISYWMFLTVLSMSFYLVFGKRRNEKLRYTHTSRAVLKQYPLAFLEKNMTMFLNLTIAFYALWCINTLSTNAHSNNLLIFTIPLVILICLRYSFIIEGDSEGDPVNVLTKDWVLITLVSLYGITTFLSIYML